MSDLSGGYREVQPAEKMTQCSGCHRSQTVVGAVATRAAANRRSGVLRGVPGKSGTVCESSRSRNEPDINYWECSQSKIKIVFARVLAGTVCFCCPLCYRTRHKVQLGPSSLRDILILHEKSKTLAFAGGLLIGLPAASMCPQVGRDNLQWPTRSPSRILSSPTRPKLAPNKQAQT